MGSMAREHQEVNDETALAVTGPAAPMLLEHAPAAVLDAAREAAVALKDVLAQKPRKVVMNGEQYLEFEDWQTLGRFYGITAKEEGAVEFVDFAGVQGFKATAVAVDRDGRELSRATAYCLNDEEKWRGRTKYEWVYSCRDGSVSPEDPGPDNIVWIDNPNKPGKKMPKRERQAVGEEKVPLFQLASMAQTRANAKVLRNVLSWVAVLAGYRPTPAEEIEDLPNAQRVVEVESRPSPAPAPTREPGDDFPDAGPDVYDRNNVAPPAPNPPAPARGGRSAKPACPQCGSAKDVINSKRNPGELYCFPCKHSWKPGAGA